MMSFRGIIPGLDEKIRTAKALLEITGVNGVGFGDNCILLLIQDEAVRASLPDEFDGVKIVTEIGNPGHFH